MNIKKVLLIGLIVIFLSGCNGLITPDTDEVGSDFYVCENILKGFYTALSNQNFTQALSYCKSGGATFDYVNNLWNTAQQYPTFYTTYQVWNICNFSYLGKYVRLNYDKSWTIYGAYGGMYGTSYSYGSLMLFEEVYGQWKMS